MIKINALDAQTKPTKKTSRKAVKPSKNTDGKQARKSAKTAPERISRRWLITLWPEHLPYGMYEAIPIDAPVKACIIDDFRLGLWLEDTCPHFRSFTASLEYGDSKHFHVQGYLELSSPVRKSALIKALGQKHYYEQANGSQQDCIDYVWHVGTHADKPGLVHTINTAGRLAYAHNENNHETTLYNTALAMVLEGIEMTEVVRSCGIGISKVYFMLSNISDRLAKQREEEEAKIEEYKRRQREICQLKEEELKGKVRHFGQDGIQPNYYANMTYDDLTQSEYRVENGKLISNIPF